jgi:pyrroloquinoline quinone (PQQ) biosynthesis protein C
MILEQAERSMEFWRRNLFDIAARYRDHAPIHQRINIAALRTLQALVYIKRLRVRYEPKGYDQVL